ncbi:MAG: metal-sensitive transcriptional regulator [Oligoflexia bacterium]|nr:metal-sensitive transcriptional regulator [Oligoflexia bacterium]
MEPIDLEKLINTPGADHRSHLNRLNRIKGQLQSIINMVEDEKYCINIIYQSKSIRNALRGFEMSVLENHFRKCVKKSIESNDPSEVDKKIDEIMTILKNS